MKTKIRYLTGVMASTALLAGTGGDALAQVVATANYCIPANDASKHGGFEAADLELGGTITGNGGGKILADGRYQLTDAALSSGQSATFFYKDPLNFRYTDEMAKTTRQFHVFFSFSMGPSVMSSGAGLAFMVQNNLSSSLGSNADGIGYGGLKKSFQFEFDTHKDTPSAGTAKYEDPFEDHIGFMLDGNQIEHPAWHKPKDGNNNSIKFATTANPYKRWYVWIDYAGGTGPDAKKFKLYFSDTKVKPAASIVWEDHKDFIGADPLNPNFPESGFDPDYVLSTQMAGQPGQGWVGFSAATYNGLIENDHFIHEFEVSNEGLPCACQVGAGLEPCKGATGTTACSAGPMTKDSGICVECTEADDKACSGDTPVCDKENEVCVECNENDDCKGMANLHCDTTSHTCVPCAADSDCKGFPATPVCANPGTAMAMCAECKVADDCKGTPATPVCAGTTNTCEECDTNVDCPNEKPACDPAMKTCSPCQTDTDCNNQLDIACATSGTKVGECVPCTENKHCPADMPTCDAPAYECRGCTMDAECTFVAPVCDVAAVSCDPCTTDAQCSRFPEKPSCQLTGELVGQCGPKPTSTDVIKGGGGCVCTVAGSSTSEDIFASLMTALGIAATITRRRRHTGRRCSRSDRAPRQIKPSR